MLDEAAVVTEVVDVLAGGALAGLAAAGDGVGPGSVERDGVALDDLGDIGAHGVEVDVVGDVVDEAADVSRFDEHERVALEDGVADPHVDEAHEAGIGGGDDVLHLHRLHHQQLLAGPTGSPSATSIATIVPCNGERTAMVPVGPSAWWEATAVVVARRGRGRSRPKSRTASGSTASTLAPARRGPGAVGSVANHSGGVVSPTATSSPTWSSTKRVVASPARRAGGRARPAGTPVFVGTPSTRSSASARDALVSASGSDGRRGVHDHLGQQRVVARARAVPGVAERVGAVAGAGGHLERRQHAAARAGRAVRGHRLHVHPALHGDPPGPRHGGLGQAELGQRAAAGDLQLGPHEVEPEHLLGDGVLDLQARVGLDEHVPARVGVDEELERPEAAGSRPRTPSAPRRRAHGHAPAGRGSAPERSR